MRIPFLYRIELRQVVSSLLLSHTADLSNQDDALRFGILEEHIEAIDEVGAVERITANADAQRLAQTHLRGLVHSLIGEGARSGDDANLATLVNMAGHNSNFALQNATEFNQTVIIYIWIQIDIAVCRVQEISESKQK